jgi:hypothetical protein
MHGPYGIVINFRKPSSLTDQDVEKAADRAHRILKTLPGFRSVVYFNVNEEDYGVAISFYTQKATDDALESIRQQVQAAYPNAVVSKGEVVPGEFVDEFIAKEGNVQRN